MIGRISLPLIASALLLSACQVNGQSQDSPSMISGDARTAANAEADHYYEIETRLGSIVVRLSNLTPKHRDNFRKLVADSFYDGTTFHRIIEGFMIQGGDPWSKDDDPMNDGRGDPGYTVPAEFDTSLVHTYGALAAARQPDQVNPLKASSGSQFYIVQGRPVDPGFFEEREQIIATRYPGFRYSNATRAIYSNKGGRPDLDMEYTVFGQVVDGFEVIDAIAAVETPRKLGQRGPLMDQATTPVVMTIRELVDYTPPPPPPLPGPALPPAPKIDGNQQN
jgi:peptidyl-prolyl cis-trans isomerase B (cyclophilin B)